MFKNKRLSSSLVILILVMMVLNMTVYGIDLESVSVRSMDEEVKLEANNKEILEEIIKSFYSPLARLDFKKDKNVIEILDRKIRDKGYEGVKVKLLKIENPYDHASIKQNGDIEYYFENPEKISFVPTISIPLVLELSLGQEKVEFKTNATFGWDYDKVEDLIKKEVFPLISEEVIRGENKDLESVEKDLVLPKRPKPYVEVSWKSSDRNLKISNELQVGGSSKLNEPYLGKVNQEANPKKLRLTAHINFNHIGNDFLGREQFFVEKDFEIIIKGSKAAITDLELREVFEKNYTEDKFKNSITREKADFNNVVSDLAMPTPRETGIKNFSQYKFTASSTSDAIDVSGYKISIKRPLPGSDPVNGKLTVYMEERNGSRKLSKDFNLRIMPLTNEELDEEIKLMDLVKENYFEAIKGENESKDRISKNLHAFSEVNLVNGKLAYIYNVREEKNTGIFPDNMSQTSDMNAPGYQEAWNKFKSSKPNIIQHENLLVHKGEYDEKVIIESVLSSKEYGKYAELYPENERLKKLYRQPVSVEVTVLGEKGGEGPKEEDDKGFGKYSIRIEGLNTSIVPKTDLEISSLDLKEFGISKEFSRVKPIHVISQGLKEASKIDISNRHEYDNANGGYIRKIGSLGTSGNSGWMYRVNNKYANDMVDTYDIKPGDEIVLYYLENWESNIYSYFEREEENMDKAGTFHGQLLGSYYDMVENKQVKLEIPDAEILVNNKKTNVKTGKDGSFSLELKEAGEYIISATRTNNKGEVDISRPYLKLKLSKSYDGLGGIETSYIGDEKPRATGVFKPGMKIVNKGEKPQTVNMITGVYKGDSLIDYTVEEALIKAKSSLELRSELRLTSGEDLNIKIFIWDGLDKQNILMKDIKEIKIKK